MNAREQGLRRFVIAGIAGLFVTVTAALAGPLLICHAFDIGNAKSLPWVSRGWNLSGNENYDTSHLAGDTLAILDGSVKTTLLHMETLRRATLYARKDPKAARELLVKLTARAQASERSPHPDALVIFDAGYLAETYKQWLGEGAQNPANGMDGYSIVKKVLSLSGNDAEMEFAAALITLRGPDGANQEHARRALAGAKSDELLARNLRTHFLGGESQTMAEMMSRKP